MNKLDFRQRRQFLEGVTMTMGGAALGALLPASGLQVRSMTCLVNAKAYPDACGDWQLDDICLAYPPYALPMQPAVPPTSASNAAVDAIDSHWVG